MGRQPIPHPTDPSAALIPLANDKGFAVVDIINLPLVVNFKWYMRTDRRRKARYATTKIGKSYFQLHHVVCPPPRGKLVDHEDGDGLNNRRSNLRVANEKQNHGNIGVTAKNTSGYRGVDKQGSKWRARLRKKSGDLNLGLFDDPTAAARAWNVAARQYFGKFAFQNPV